VLKQVTRGAVEDLLRKTGACSVCRRYVTLAVITGMKPEVASGLQRGTTRACSVWNVWVPNTAADTLQRLVHYCAVLSKVARNHSHPHSHCVLLLYEVVTFLWLESLNHTWVL
jgi:hypothetical protein